MPDASETIYCEVCRLPHRPGVARCEDCGHSLGSPPDWDALRGQLSYQRGKILLGIAAIAAIVAANLLLFQGAGYVILLAPIGWTVFGGYRYMVLSRRLRALGQL